MGLPAAPANSRSRPVPRSTVALRASIAEAVRRDVVLLYYSNTVTGMALSVRLEPAMEARIAQEAQRLGISKSEFVKDALERVLGLKSPAQLLKQVRSNTPIGATNASEQVSKGVRTRLREKRSP